VDAAPFVGRERELASLLGGLDALEAGQGRLFVVTGEPGIGKTRLADELAAQARARGLPIGWGAAWDGGGAPALWPWIQALRGLRPALPEPGERLRSDLGSLWDEAEPDPAPGPGLDLELQRFRLFDALRALLQAGAARSPLVIVLEDLHAADRGSLLALRFVARSLRGLRALLLATAREEVDSDAGAAELLGAIGREGTVLRLERLARRDVAALMGALEPVGPSLVDEVHALSGGNPLFVLETLRLVRSGRPAHEVPERVGQLVAERLARLEPATRGALAAAAVLGREVDSAALAEVLSAAPLELEARLRSARLAGLLEPVGPGRIGFSHALFRERLLEDLPPSTRTSLHLRAGDVLARFGTAGMGSTEEAVARHLLAALPEGDPSLAAKWAIRAAARAARDLAFDRARQFLEGALAAGDLLPPDPGRRVDVDLDLAQVLARSGQGERAREVCRAAADRARALGDRLRLARAALAHGAELRVGVVDPILLAVLEEALVGLGDAEPGLRARLMARLAAARQPASDPAGPIQLAQQALALARTVNDPEVLLATLSTAGSALGTYAPPSHRCPLARELVALALERGDLVLAQQGLARLAVDAVELCDLGEAAVAAASHERLGAALGHPRWRWRSALLRSMVALAQGRWADAAGAQAEAAARAAEADDPAAGPALGLHRFGAFRARESGGASELQALARDEPGAVSAHPLMSPLARASMLARLNERDAAARVVEDLGPGLSPGLRSFPLALVTLADVTIRIGDRARAGELLPHVSALSAAGWRAMSWGAVAYVWDGPLAALAGGLLATLERWHEAIPRLEEALADADASGARPAAAEVRRELALALARRGGPEDGARAAALLDEAAAEAAALDMVHLADRVKAAAAAVGPAPARTAAVADGPAIELAREGDVWAVSSGGRTVRLRHSRALEILDHLLSNPGREFHALDLGGGEADEPIDPGDAGEVLDARSRDAYRRRVVELEQELDEAEAWSDAGRVARLRAELEFLREELSRGLGLGGRLRRAAGAPERARVNVQKRLRGVIRKIGAALPEVGRHLEREIRTGALVSYRRGT
jgi:hypothetical protein